MNTFAIMEVSFNYYLNELVKNYSNKYHGYCQYGF